MKHKHADVIKAWADGAQIEWRIADGGEWRITHAPEFIKYCQYRVRQSVAVYAADEQTDNHTGICLEVIHA